MVDIQICRFIQGRSLRNTLNLIFRKLSLLKKDRLHTFEDVEHYKFVLEHLESRWKDGREDAYNDLRELDSALALQCQQLWSSCYQLVKEMEQETLEMPEQVRKVHAELVDLHAKLQEMANGEPTSSEVSNVIQQLDRIDAKRMSDGGTFGGFDVEAPPPGHAMCVDLLHHCYELARHAAYRAHEEPVGLMTVTDSLRGIRIDLRKLRGAKHHTDADIAHFRFLLGAIASSEAEYSKEWKGSRAEKLLIECQGILTELEATSESMPPEVENIYDKLQALKKQLSVAASSSDPPDKARMDEWVSAVHAIDDARAASNGIFGCQKGNLEAPAGQIACNRVLKQCHQLIHQLDQR